VGITPKVAGVRFYVVVKMRKILTMFSGCLVFSVTLLGCLPVQQQMRLDQDLEEIKRRLAFVERKVTSQSLDLKDEAGRGLTALTKRQADVEAAMDNLRVEFQALEGRLKEVARENRQLRNELSLMRDDLALKIADLEEGHGQPPPSPAKAAPASSAPAPPAPAPVPSTDSTESKPEELYREGLDLVLKTQKYPEARAIFQQFLKKYPDHPLAVNATYWIGEAYYGEKQYENAILQFQDVIQKYSQHAKAASAMYKQAFAFHALGDVQNARLILEKLMETYPQSSEANRAKEKLTEWK
jgi:tol-pal system protein YbgF